MGNRALVVLTILSRVMAAKMDKPILHVTGWVNFRIKIAVARSHSRVMHGYRAPSTFQTWEPEWASGSGLGLAQ